MSLSEDGIEQLERLRVAASPTQAELVREAVRLHNAIRWVRQRVEPIEMVDDDIVISNRAAWNRATEALVAPSTSQVKPSGAISAAARRVWDSLELKPGMFGIQIDLKKLLSKGAAR